MLLLSLMLLSFCGGCGYEANGQGEFDDNRTGLRAVGAHIAYFRTVENFVKLNILP